MYNANLHIPQVNQLLLLSLKVIHVARNPRDVCVSYFHFGRMLNSIDFQGSFKDYFERFISGKGKMVEAICNIDLDR